MNIKSFSKEKQGQPDVQYKDVQLGIDDQPRQAKASNIHIQSEQELSSSDPRTFREALLRMFPHNFWDLIRGAAAIICLIEFFHSHNTDMLLTALALASSSIRTSSKSSVNNLPLLE